MLGNWPNQNNNKLEKPEKLIKKDVIYLFNINGGYPPNIGAYWPGFSVYTTKGFTASKNLRNLFSCNSDRRIKKLCRIYFLAISFLLWFM